MGLSGSEGEGLSWGVLIGKRGSADDESGNGARTNRVGYMLGSSQLAAGVIEWYYYRT